MKSGDLDRYISGSSLSPTMVIRFATQIPTSEFSSAALKHANFCAAPLIPGRDDSAMKFCLILERDKIIGDADSISTKTFLLAAVDMEFIHLGNFAKMRCDDLSSSYAGGGALIKYSIHWSEPSKSGLIDRSYLGGFYATN